MRVEDNPAAPAFEARIARVRELLDHEGIDCLLVSSPPNVRYLVGFTGSYGWLLISTDDVVIATDSRYIEEARQEFPWCRACLVANSLIDFVVSHVTEAGIRCLGFEAESVSYARTEQLRSELVKRSISCELRSTTGLVEQMRAIKEAGELHWIEQAAALVDGAFRHVVEVMRPGMTEVELAWQIERWLRENGSGPVPFGVIVASGPHAALPHASPGDKKLQEGEPVVIDLGASCNGYCSDLTRTVFLKEMASGFAEVYDTVLAAQHAAVDRLRPDMAAREADEIARSVIRRASMEECFVHGLGHGVGLEIHERPVISSRSSDVLCEGMVFTVEPGVYVAGWGGVRIEDTVVLSAGGARLLTRFDKDNPIIPSNTVTR